MAAIDDGTKQALDRPMKMRPEIPSAIKREVRQACGFGCVICGYPLCAIDHIEEYAVVKKHETENLCLLCDHHHRLKTNGLIKKDDIRKARLNPRNFQRNMTGIFVITIPECNAISILTATGQGIILVYWGINSQQLKYEPFARRSCHSGSVLF